MCQREVPVAVVASQKEYPSDPSTGTNHEGTNFSVLERLNQLIPPSTSEDPEILSPTREFLSRPDRVLGEQVIPAFQLRAVEIQFFEESGSLLGQLSNLRALSSYLGVLLPLY